jgi:hypothetical protein
MYVLHCKDTYSYTQPSIRNTYIFHTQTHTYIHTYTTPHSTYTFLCLLFTKRSLAAIKTFHSEIERTLDF